MHTPTRARAAALALRLPDRVQDALAHALERAVGAAEVSSSAGSEYCAFVFSQPPPLRISFTSMSSLLPLIEVDDRRARAEVVAGVLAGDRIDRVRAQLAAPRRLGDRLADLRAHPDLVRADRRLHLEGRHAGVLADRRRRTRPPGRCSAR